VFLDGVAVFELGMVMPAVGWFRLCRDQGYNPEAHWDLDPAMILFRQVVPALAGEWREHPLPFNEAGLPPGVVCLATVREAWEQGVAALGERLRGHAVGERVAACLKRLPLRAVVFHDDPGRRRDFVGTGMDDPLLGVYLHLGASRATRVTVSKATLNATGGLRWSPWQAGGEWREDGREYHGTLGAEAFLEAAGWTGVALPVGFAETFMVCLDELTRSLDPVVEAYRQTYPAGIPWHRDPLTRYMHRMIVDARHEKGRILLVLDDGTEVVVGRRHERPAEGREAFRAS